MNIFVPVLPPPFFLTKSKTLSRLSNFCIRSLLNKNIYKRQQIGGIVPCQQKKMTVIKPSLPSVHTLSSRQKMLQSQFPLIISSDFTLHFVTPITSRISTMRVNQIFVKYRANQSKHTINYPIIPTLHSSINQSSSRLIHLAHAHGGGIYGEVCFDVLTLWLPIYYCQD